MKRTKPVVGQLVAYPKRGTIHSPDVQEAGIGIVIDTPSIWLDILGQNGDVYKGIRRDSVRIIQ